MYFIPSILVLLLKRSTFYRTTSSMNISNQDLIIRNHKDFMFENGDNLAEKKQGRNQHFSKERYLVHQGKTWGSAPREWILASASM